MVSATAAEIYILKEAHSLDLRHDGRITQHLQPHPLILCILVDWSATAARKLG